MLVRRGLIWRDESGMTYLIDIEVVEPKKTVSIWKRLSWIISGYSKR